MKKDLKFFPMLIALLASMFFILPVSAASLETKESSTVNENEITNEGINKSLEDENKSSNITNDKDESIETKIDNGIENIKDKASNTLEEIDETKDEVLDETISKDNSSLYMVLWQYI